MNGTPLQLALRELQSLFSDRIAWAIMAGVSVVLGLSGPFGTFGTFPLPQRIAYWGAITVSTYAVGLGVAMLVVALLRDRVRAHWPLVVLAGAAGGPPVTLVVMLINLLVYRELDVIDPLTLLRDCTLIAIGIAVLGELTSRKTPVATAESQSLPQSPALLDRIAHPLRG